MATYAMKQDIDPAEINAHDLNIKKMNWLVIYPVIMEEIEDAISAMNNRYPQIDFHTEVDKVNRCIQLSTIYTAEDNNDTAETETDNTADDPTSFPISLTISQGDLGYIAVVMRSGLMDSDGNSENLIVWQVYDSPTKLSKYAIKLVISDFMTYVRVLNSNIKNSFREKKRIEYIKFRSRNYTEDNFDPIKCIFEKYWLKSLWAVTVIGAGLYAILKNVYGM
jgi:hypothetical protein